MKQKVLILDTVHPRLIERLEPHFVLVQNTSCTADELKSMISEFVGMVLRSRITITRELIDAGVNLRFLARVGAGMESIDVEYAESKGVRCLNSPEGNRDAVAEHALGMLLNLSNNLNRADLQVRQGKWEREANRGWEVKGKIVGIIGFGNMGSAFAQRLQGFDCKVIAYDKKKNDYAPEYVEEVGKEEIFAQADIVSMHIPLNEDNYYLVDENWFASFEKPIVLINTARGPVVKTAALLDAMHSGKVIAAGLDVLEYEESSFEQTKELTDIPDFKRLSAMDNVIFTPHVGGWTKESKLKLADFLVDKILDLSGL